MVETYHHQVWTPSKWQQERDAAKVPPRACPGVNVAAELDRFHSEMARAVSPASLGAVKRLSDRINTYVQSVQPRFPVWARRVTGQLLDRLQSVQSDLDAIGRAQDGYNKAVLLVQSNFETARNDIEDWMDGGGETRLNSRHADMLVVGLRELYLNGQRLAYVTDRLDKKVWNDARKYWGAMDVRRSPDRLWLEGVTDLRIRLRAVEAL